MRLKYKNEQEKQHRIDEIKAIIENDLAKTNFEKLSLEVELQFLRGDTNGYGDPIAYVTLDTVGELEVIFNRYKKRYSIMPYNIKDEKFDIVLPYWYSNNIEKLLEEICEYYLDETTNRKGIVGRNWQVFS